MVHVKAFDHSWPGPPSCEVLEPFIGCNIHPSVLHGGAGTISELGGSLLHKKICSKMLILNNTIKINGNQTIGRQFNFTQFNEASMQNEDFGKEFTVKVLFRGEQRWRRFMRSHSLQVSKPYSTQYSKMVDFASTWNG
jgi:predicted metalloprotease